MENAVAISQEMLDKEWVVLINAAIEVGLSLAEVQEFIRSRSVGIEE